MANTIMLAAYIEAALWSSTDFNDLTFDTSRSDGPPLDKNYSADDIAPETAKRMAADVEAFWSANADDIGTEYERAGHDLWLTRNHHGAGFWDGDWAEDVGRRLTEAAHKIGEFNLYVGDDKKIHGT